MVQWVHLPHQNGGLCGQKVVIVNVAVSVCSVVVLLSNKYVEEVADPRLV